MTTLGVSGTQFTIDSVPTFLLGVAYYDVLHAHVEDLPSLVAFGVNLVRISMTAPTEWGNTNGAPGDSCLNTSGNWVAGAEAAVLAFVDACDAVGIICDVVVSNGGFDNGFPINDTEAVRQQAVTTVGTSLASRTNVMFDFANEHTDSANDDATWESWDLPGTLDAVAPGKLWYFGDSGDHMVQKNSWTVSAGQRATITLHHQTWGEPVMSANMAVATDANWFNEMYLWYNALRAELDLLSLDIPIYLYEPPWAAIDAMGGTLSDAAQWLKSITDAKDAGFAGYVVGDVAGVWLQTAPFFPGEYGGLDSVKAKAVLTGWSQPAPSPASIIGAGF